MSNNSECPPNNGAFHNIVQIIKSVMSSAAEAEIGALFLNSRQAIPARTLLEEMGHVQPPTPIMTDNTTALGFVSKNLQPKRTKSTDMRYWWMRDRSDQKQFRYYWGKGRIFWQITSPNISVVRTTAKSAPNSSHHHRSWTSLGRAWVSLPTNFGLPQGVLNIPVPSGISGISSRR